MTGMARVTPLVSLALRTDTSAPRAIYPSVPSGTELAPAPARSERRRSDSHDARFRPRGRTA